MTTHEAHFQYILRIADNALILGQRLSEWCGHGPILEQDIALTNFSLDFIGQSRNLYTYAGKLEGKGKTEDDLAFMRNEEDFFNVLLVEQPNGHWGTTITRQFLFDVFNYLFHRELCESSDEQLAAIAAKSLKEITYHLKFSSEWMIRLGDGTEESHQKMQEALEDLWMYTGELFEMDDVDEEMLKTGIGVDLIKIKPLFDQKVAQILEEATLAQPEVPWMQSGGKQGRHTENLGHLLAEMQYIQRAYPGLEW
jgi:ring-1,2-phenylacetyl-CoA epoxidase subunit PaaC